jgi:murein L,D-transpeptidase YcbB/YkuD
VDTSLSPAVQYTHLVLDSLSIHRFIDSFVKNDSNAGYIRNFYNSRNFQFAWFDEQGLTEQGEAFWNIYQMRREKGGDSTAGDTLLDNGLAALSADDSAALPGALLRDLELRLTWHFFKYLFADFNGKISPLDMQWHIPRRRLNEKAVLDSFLTAKEPALHPFGNAYYRLQNRMAAYVTIAEKGGWGTVPDPGEILGAGTRNSAIPPIKRRLHTEGFWPSQDTSIVFTDSLQLAIKTVQQVYGRKQSGLIDKTLIAILNIPVQELIRKMKINLERMRWMPEEGPDRIVVNIPDFRLHVFQNDHDTLDMDIVVGRAANQTVIFSDTLRYIVFSPYWNVPASIVKKEIAPAIRTNPDYLRRNDMEITGYANGLPVIRQLPGPGNALGRVKFLFPNRYHIYLHDTPAKSLFKKETRAFSHGCIRLRQPFELAEYLLQNDRKWTGAAIHKAMRRNKETWVRPDHPLPVFIVYFTAWVDSNGKLNFRDDIYGHDKRMASHLFE